ncbi:MAG: type II toxin-antitoxin system HicB family antitoxin [Spirochaetota bacterium]
MNTYTAVIKHERDWWYGWVEEVPGVNGQEATREELMVALKECLAEALDMNRQEARDAADSDYSEDTIAL